MVNKVVHTVYYLADCTHIVLRSLNELKSVGPGGVSPRLLKHCAKELARPLTDLFQKVTRAAEFPKSWKVARVTPVY